VNNYVFKERQKQMNANSFLLHCEYWCTESSFSWQWRFKSWSGLWCHAVVLCNAGILPHHYVASQPITKLFTLLSVRNYFSLYFIKYSAHKKCL